MEVRDARLLAEARDASSAAHPVSSAAASSEHQVPSTGSPPPSWDDRQSHEAAALTQRALTPLPLPSMSVT
eukprot:SM000167S02974  [mRNA]  locus=s167:223444:223656:+ [translate_table: standard]